MRRNHFFAEFLTAFSFVRDDDELLLSTRFYPHVAFIFISVAVRAANGASAVFRLAGAQCGTFADSAVFASRIEITGYILTTVWKNKLGKC